MTLHILVVTLCFANCGCTTYHDHVVLSFQLKKQYRTNDRGRASSNSNLGEEDYHDILQRWLKMFPAATFTSLLGPYVSLEREVTPSALVRAADLLKMFVQGGCDECCLRGPCLETALVKQERKRTGISFGSILCLGPPGPVGFPELVRIPHPPQAGRGRPLKSGQPYWSRELLGHEQA